LPGLFDELRIKDATLRNRILVSPMCQYSAENGLANDWHLVHLGARAVGGAAVVIAEATGVSQEGRITPACTGIWSDKHAEAFAPAARFIKAHGAIPGIQIAHAGRKASAEVPWKGGKALPADDPRRWETIGPSAVAFGGNLPDPPREMTLADIARVQGEFVAAAKRALVAGFEWLELHFAHGYLAQSFFSPLANKRTDAYGGSFEGRARFLIETVEAVRAVWPERMPLTARLGVVDYVPGEQPLEEAIELVKRFKARGLDLIDVSLGSNTPDGSRIPKAPAFLVPTAARIKREAGILTGCSWLITEAHQADEIIRDGQLDVVILARAMLGDAYWAYHAAQALGLPEPHKLLPVQYARVSTLPK
jgi:2,4-dienoyl-CoA reductase-like NADH-dependent reductase (Old Yellow Enzyme family)